MGKLSKSDQDPNQGVTDRAILMLLLSRKSPHFNVGERVVMANQGGVVVESPRPGALTVQWDDDRLTTIEPIALKR